MFAVVLQFLVVGVNVPTVITSRDLEPREMTDWPEVITAFHSTLLSSSVSATEHA